MALTIGVFDSGIGGEAVAETLRQAFPSATVTTVNDRIHIPYGDKSPEEVRALTDTAIQPLLGHDIVVIACNTATMLALSFLRARYPGQDFVGIEPMIQPAAALTKSGVVCVCATPATLASERYDQLKQLSATHCTVLEPNCSQWASLIEHNEINEQHIRATLQHPLEQGADVVVLGCTHYHWIKDMVETIVDGHAVVLEPSAAVVRHITTLTTQRETVLQR